MVQRARRVLGEIRVAEPGADAMDAGPRDVDELPRGRIATAGSAAFTAVEIRLATVREDEVGGVERTLLEEMRGAGMGRVQPGPLPVDVHAGLAAGRGLVDDDCFAEGDWPHGCCQATLPFLTNRTSGTSAPGRSPPARGTCEQDVPGDEAGGGKERHHTAGQACR